MSSGCKNCYAEALTLRNGLNVFGASPRRYFKNPDHWSEPLKWNRRAAAAGEVRLVFCASMADLFEGLEEQLPFVADTLELVRVTPSLRWQLLTKRPHQVMAIVSHLANDERLGGDLRRMLIAWEEGSPPANVWMGTSAENQEAWDMRVPVLWGIPASVRFVSAEPLLGPIAMSSHRVDWVIAGGESGDFARPMSKDWVRSLRDQCAAIGVRFFYKQAGGRGPERYFRDLDGREHLEFPEKYVRSSLAAPGSSSEQLSLL